MRSWLPVALALVTTACTHGAPARAPSGGMIAGIVRDAQTGAGVGDTVIVLRRPGEIAPVQDRSNGDGAFMIPALPPGDYHVAAYLHQRPIGERDVQVRDGELAGVDFTVPAIGQVGPDLNAPGAPTLWRFRAPDADPATATIEGTVADAVRGTRLRGAVVAINRTGTYDTYPAIADDQGRYRVDALPPGSYDVSASYTVVRRGALEVRRNRVEVAGGETVVVPLWLEVDPEH
jgi:hypothetical protein